MMTTAVISNAPPAIPPIIHHFFDDFASSDIGCTGSPLVSVEPSCAGAFVSVLPPADDPPEISDASAFFRTASAYPLLMLRAAAATDAGEGITTGIAGVGNFDAIGLAVTTGNAGARPIAADTGFIVCTSDDMGVPLLAAVVAASDVPVFDVELDPPAVGADADAGAVVVVAAVGVLSCCTAVVSFASIVSFFYV